MLLNCGKMRIRYKEKRELVVKEREKVGYYNEMVKFAQIVTQTNTRTVLPAIDKLGGIVFRREFKKYYNGGNITENNKLN